MRGPEYAVERGLGEVVVDTGEGGEAGDPEDGGAEKLGEGGEEAEFVEVMRAEEVEGGEPGPGPGQVGGGGVELAVEKAVQGDDGGSRGDGGGGGEMC